MSSSIWGADAEEFRPERWEHLKDVPNTHFFTFQHGIHPSKGKFNEIGPRSCIGRKFAETEMRVLLAVLIGSFEFKKVPGQKVEKYSLITMRPKNGMFLNISRVE
jgi:cytochrome P450